MPFVKSYSNYVLRKKHQDVADGTIYERDITTIGGLDRFSVGQIPVYRSGNFLITVNGTNTPQKDVHTSKWAENKNGEVWTIDTITSMTTTHDREDEEKVVLRQDYYDFRDFAYYGSLSELFRVSLNNIVKTFPGELYFPNETSKIYSGTDEYVRITVESGDTNVTVSDFYIADNPFDVDLLSMSIDCDNQNGFNMETDTCDDYDIISGVSENIEHITSWKFEPTEDGHEKCWYCVGKITIDDNLKIYPFHTTDNQILYLIPINWGTPYLPVHIRPKKEVYEKYYSNLTAFERLLVNPNTTPRYSSTFSVISEDDYGYVKKLENFQINTRPGGYNIDITSSFVNKLVEIGAFYDERFSDNLWRSMTHEAIKNFDWTHSREYLEGDAEENIIGGERMKKALAIFAREFDEIKSYIDSIEYSNRITYDKRGNLPDYFIKDVVEAEGWDIINVTPFTISNGKTSQDGSKTFKPYEKTEYENGYFVYYTCDGETPVRHVEPANPGEIYRKIDGKNREFGRILDYSEQLSSVTMSEMTVEFLRRLKINSRQIWRKKGTIEGIESLLSLFGLKSSRFDKDNWDYDIKEYTSFSERIEENWDQVHNTYQIEWVNSTKNITYDNRLANITLGQTDSEYPYHGLPVAYREPYSNETQYISALNGMPTNNKAEAYRYITYDPNNTENYVKRRFLYPYFTGADEIDGNPYFQMNGGWLQKTIGLSNGSEVNFAFDENDNIVTASTPIYTETYRTVRSVDTLSDLLSLSLNEVSDGDTIQVIKIDENTAIIDGSVYPIQYDRVDSSHTHPYISLITSSKAIFVGNAYLTNEITVYGKNGLEQDIDISTRPDGYEVKAYINVVTSESGETTWNFIARDTHGIATITSFSVFVNDASDENITNYFTLVNDSGIGKIYSDGEGWKRLTKDDEKYKLINLPQNYVNGNNPHIGNLMYDGGKEYFEYFKQLFKYSLDKDLFDPRCYDDVQYAMNDWISKIGFHDAGDNVLEDSKISFFGNYKKTDGSFLFYGNDQEKLERYNTKYGLTGDNGYSISTEDTKPAIISINKEHIYENIDSDNVDDVTNQIVNTKYLTITFKTYNEYNIESNKWKEEVKYLDGVVVPYLTQVIPSTTILKVKYEHN